MEGIDLKIKVYWNWKMLLKIIIKFWRNKDGLGLRRLRCIGDK